MFKVPDNRALFLKPAEPLGKSAEIARPGDLSPPSTEGMHPQPYHETEPRPPNNEADVRTMIVGPGVSVSGTINSCSRLVLEGTIDAKLDDCQHVIVAQTGVFKGDVSTDNADVHGRFEGDLVVRKRLLVRATGQVSGTLTYGEIEIECGGKIAGKIRPHEDGNAVSYSMPAEAGKDPLTGSLQATELPFSMATHGPAPHLVAANSAMPTIDVSIDC
jgi:cytoskeletal protein CcmA (bactofilin family)